MPKKSQHQFQPLLHFAFIVVLGAIIGLYTLYDDTLNEESHKSIVDAQKDFKFEDNTWKVSRNL